MSTQVITCLTRTLHKASHTFKFKPRAGLLVQPSLCYTPKLLSTRHNLLSLTIWSNSAVLAYAVSESKVSSSSIYASLSKHEDLPLPLLSLHSFSSLSGSQTKYGTRKRKRMSGRREIKIKTVTERIRNSLLNRNQRSSKQIYNNAYRFQIFYLQNSIPRIEN